MGFPDTTQDADLFAQKSPENGRALVVAFRYLILGTLGASFYLLGVVFFYASTGTLNMADLAQQMAAHSAED